MGGFPAGLYYAPMIHVIAEIRLSPGRRDEFLGEFHRLTPLVRTEEGCIEYDGAIEIPSGIGVQLPVRGDVFTVVEKWRDVEALRAHLDAPHMHEHWRRAEGMTQGTTIRVYEPA